MDNQAHGERKGKQFNEIVLKKSSLMDVYEIRRLIKESADDIVKIIDYYEPHRNVDTSKTGISGISMGGFITYRTAVIDNRIKSLAPLIGSPYWEDIPEVQSPTQIDMSKASMSKLVSFSQKYSPNNVIMNC